MKKTDWVIFPNLKIEVNFEQEQNGKKFGKIKIPKRCRLIRIEELGEVMDYIIKRKINIASFLEQPIISYRNKYVARFNADSGGVYLNCDRNPGDSCSALGVIFAREIK